MKLSEEVKRNLSKNRMGNKNPMYGKTKELNPFYGKHHTEETRKKMSEKRKLRVTSEETRKKLSESHKGKLIGIKNPMYMKFGKLNPMYGKHLSESAKQKIRESHLGKTGLKGSNHPNWKNAKNDPQIIEEHKKKRKSYYSDPKNKIRIKKQHTIYRKSSKGKEIRKRIISKRQRNLGFNPINDWFMDSDAHHINKNDVIYIPSKLHESYSGHCLDKPETMIKINIAAFQYLINSIRVLE